MAAINRGPGGRHFESGVASVTMSSGSGTEAITFTNEFNQIPEICVVPDAADEVAGATYSAASGATTGFTVSVASSQFTTGTIDVVWFACEKG